MTIVFHTFGSWHFCGKLKWYVRTFAYYSQLKTCLPASVSPVVIPISLLLSVAQFFSSSESKTGFETSSIYVKRCIKLVTYYKKKNNLIFIPLHKLLLTRFEDSFKKTDRALYNSGDFGHLCMLLKRWDYWQVKTGFSTMNKTFLAGFTRLAAAHTVVVTVYVPGTTFPRDQVCQTWNFILPFGRELWQR